MALPTLTFEQIWANLYNMDAFQQVSDQTWLPPKCDCFKIRQVYRCGCPDLGWDNRGHAVASLHQCLAYWLPSHWKLAIEARGFQHIPESHIHLLHQIQFLPFPCFKHQDKHIIYVTPQEATLRINESKNPKNNPPRAANLNKILREHINEAHSVKRCIAEVEAVDPELRAREAKSTKKRKTATTNYGVSLRDKQNIHDFENAHFHMGLVRRDAMPAALEEREVDQCADDSKGDPPDRPWEYNLNHYRPERRPWDNGGNPFHPNYEESYKGYKRGAYMLDERALDTTFRQAWYNKMRPGHLLESDVLRNGWYCQM
ncbi:hypothetical protein B0H63DRAFT_542840 [Podospora didyma]|uniref:Uncharacterized protein n=1 Tax=Podospora didyma TaxID=330526 RepID=A0AAE0NNK7_9PEZI|nr:hypothetical protein B0H63DRAFT_542840 [Podospora didyma]